MGGGGVLQSGEGRATGQLVIDVQGPLVDPQLEHRGRVQCIGVIGILIGASKL